MRNRIRNFFFGKPLKDSDLSGERLSVFWGVPVFYSDTISTVTYAGEEILIVLLPLLGIAGYRRFLWIAAALMALLLILVLGYRQTIEAYPQGGGGYTVALNNLGERPGVIAGASLVIEYELIVAVSASTAAAAVVSVFPAAAPYKCWIALFLILFISWLHLRGTRVASVAVGIPTYFFVLLMLVMIVRGAVAAPDVQIVPDLPETQPGRFQLFLCLTKRKPFDRRHTDIAMCARFRVIRLHAQIRQDIRKHRPDDRSRHLPTADIDPGFA